MRSGILWLLPDQLMPLVLVGLAIGVILGIVTGRTVMAFIVLLILSPILGGIAEQFFGSMPLSISLVILGIIGISVLRGIASLIIGSGASDEMTGQLAADFVRFILRCCIFPFRIVGWIFRSISMGRM